MLLPSIHITIYILFVYVQWFYLLETIGTAFMSFVCSTYFYIIYVLLF